MTGGTWASELQSLRARKRWTQTDEARFLSRVDKTGECWLYGHPLNRAGYGVFSVLSVPILAHRWAYRRWVGPVSQGMHVLHRCDNPPCVRPDHLFLGTNADNRADSTAKGRTARGEGQPQAKLTEATVALIRATPYRRGLYAALGRQLGVAPSTVSAVWRRKRWTWL